MARPSLYTADIADHVIGELRTGRSLQDICRDAGMPHRETFMNWMREDRDGLAARYREARLVARSVPGYRGYTAETADRVLEELMCGRGLVDICRDPGMPDHTTVNRWVATDREGFAARYRSARQVGRLSRAGVPYTAETAKEVLGELMTGRTLRDICAEADMPSTNSVQQWVRDDRDGFKARYIEARKFGCQMIGDEVLQIVDGRRNDWIRWQQEDGSMAQMLDPERINRTHQQVKARRWQVARMEKAFGGPVDMPANEGADAVYKRGLAEMLKLIDGRSRGLPSEDQPLDDGQFDDGPCDDK